MRIQHNIAALNSYRQLNTNNNAVSKNLEKLSSGYKINRAGDDAAGLAISEKMRAQITGLTVAQKNANDGISLVQTAEGALTEVHSMLNRMKELATQAANGTYNDTDREKLQSEINALNDEIDRISESTNFNGIQLLDGSIGDVTGVAVSGAAGAAGTDAVGASAGTSSVVDGVYTEGKDAQKAESSFFLSKEVQLTSGTTSANSITFEFTASTSTGSATKFTVTVTGSGTNTTDKFNMEDVWKAVNGMSGTASVNGTGTIALEGGKNLSVKLALTDGGGGDKTTIDQFFKKYSVNFENNELKISAVDGGKAYGVAGTSLTVNGNGAAWTTIDKAAMEAALKKDLGDSGTAQTITLGTKSKADTLGTDAVQATYKVGSAVVELNALDKLTGQALQIGGQIYVMKATTEKLSDEMKKYIEANKDKVNLVEYDATKTGDTDAAAANRALANAINKNSAATGIEANIVTGSNGLKVQLQETEGRGQQIIDTKNDGSVKSVDFDTAIVNGGFKVGVTAGGETTLKFNDELKAGDRLTINGKTYEFVKDAADVKGNNIAVVMGADAEANAQAFLDALKANDAASFPDAKIDAADPTTVNLGNKMTVDSKGEGLYLQVGDTAEDYQRVNVTIGSVDTDSLKLKDIDISTEAGASKATDAINAAIDQVSTVRSDLGAIQNRLEHTINNLGVTTENLTAAESRIRDTDMAEEMMAYTKNNILVQAAQAMLAQANTVPQGVLQLLQ